MINGAGWGWISGWKRPSSWRQWFGLAVAAHTPPQQVCPPLPRTLVKQNQACNFLS